VSAPHLFAELRRRGVEVETDGVRLLVDAPVGAISPKIRAELLDHKLHLIRLLEQERDSLK
jgi:hypothetical protein